MALVTVPADVGSGDLHSSELSVVLEAGRDRGFLGPASVAQHLAHARGFVALVAEFESRFILDLGSGGGVPGLVIAISNPEVEIALLDRGTRRCEFLSWAVSELELGHRVTVVEGEAESVARMPDWDGWADAVTARSFGPSAVTAEAATRFLRRGGQLVVSEPPRGGSDSEQPADENPRWPRTAVAVLGLELAETRAFDASSFAVLVREGDLDARYPRRAATVRKRPLF